MATTYLSRSVFGSRPRAYPWNGRIVRASPLIALEVKDPFDCYIFCEKSPALLSALRERVAADYPAANAEFVLGDVNDNVPAILSKMPAYSSESPVLGFCFVDPRSLGNLRFSTIRGLATDRLMDFLVLVPTGMDAQRNEQALLNVENAVLDEFLGNQHWREEWQTQRTKGRKFEAFVVDAFGESMKHLDYKYGGVGETKLVRSTEKNLLLYRLAFFSRSPRGGQFWDKARKSSSGQRELF